MTSSPIVLIELGVGGMTCDDCVVRVKTALEGVPGVEEASVDLASRSAVVRARDGIDAAALAAAVRDAGPPAGHRYNAFERRRQPLDPGSGPSRQPGAER